MSTLPLLGDIAAEARKIIARAEAAGVVIDDGNVVDLLADNISPRVSLADIRCALVVAGLGGRFPRSTSSQSTYASMTAEETRAHDANVKWHGKEYADRILLDERRRKLPKNDYSVAARAQREAGYDAEY